MPGTLNRVNATRYFTYCQYGERANISIEWILWYIHGTTNAGLEFERDEDSNRI